MFCVILNECLVAKQFSVFQMKTLLTINYLVDDNFLEFKILTSNLSVIKMFILRIIALKNGLKMYKIDIILMGFINYHNWPIRQFFINSKY